MINSQADNKTQVILKLFGWFNKIASAKREPFTPEEVATHFAEEATMITNGKVVCTGIKAHFDHFLELNAHYLSLSADIENMCLEQQQERIYLRYFIHAKTKDNQSEKLHVDGFMEFCDEKISLFEESVVKEKLT